MPGFHTLKQEGYPLTATEFAVIESIAALSDPGADRIMFWDESENAFGWLQAGSGITISGTTISASASVPTTITVANEVTDTTCFPLFVTAATGDLGPKTNANFAFNSNTGVLTLAGLALGAGSITMTGSIGVTGSRVTKGWFTDIESTNMPTVGGTSLSDTFVGKALFDANTILYATADNTPLALTIGASTIVGRKATGDIVALTGAEALTISGGESTSNKKTTLSDDSDTYYPSQKAVKTAVDAKAPSASPSLTGTVTLSDNCRIDLTLPTADTYCTGNTTDSFASGYSASAADLVFMGSSSKWLEVDADAVATCKGLLGIALEAKNDTEAMKVALPGSFVRFDAWNWTVGATLYAGETLGSMQETIPTGADAIIKVVGFAVNADTIYFNPSPDQQTTVA